MKLLIAALFAEKLKIAPLAKMYELTGGRMGRRETYELYLNLKMMHEALQGLRLEARNVKAKTFVIQLDSVVFGPGVHDERANGEAVGAGVHEYGDATSASAGVSDGSRQLGALVIRCGRRSRLRAARVVGGVCGRSTECARRAARGCDVAGCAPSRRARVGSGVVAQREWVGDGVEGR